MSFEYTTPAIIKWQLDDFMKIIDAFECAFADTVHHKICVSNDYRTILMHIAGKSLLTTRELLTLCAHGYPDGALALGRNLYEQMIVVAFFEFHKENDDFQRYIDDFFLSYDVQRNKCLRKIDKYIPDGNISEYTEKYEELKKCTQRDIRKEYWWAGVNTFSDLSDSILDNITDESFRRFMGKHYATYKRACISLHAGCMGNSVRMGNDTGFSVVDTSPTLFGQSTPLGFAVTSLIYIIGVLCDNFNIEHTKFLDPLNELLIVYQKQESMDTIQKQKVEENVNA